MSGSNKWGLVMLCLVMPLAGAQSLIDPDGYRALTGDRRGYQVGETLTVLVVESTNAESSAGTGADSQTAIGGGANTDSSSHQFSLRLTGNTDGIGQTRRRGQVRANVAVRIVEQLPEGLLRVSGVQAVTINDERQRIRVDGLVRPDDISYENTVFSYRLAEAQIDIVGDGVVADAQKQNIFYRALKWLRIL
ncbi:MULTISPECIES: flagellar basal body L-ring protein FlgH [Pseudomonas]|uniref:flagellar basal body L-ring protein FlgH n=1 Tax=Pseudomonas TaxID=286 RepID=UPI001C80BDB7|nr:MULTISPECIES: flagellar basal body L-ring protein FlgH [Pseudomonas]MDG9930380.1 flagellar basal body L-ring protein FlgH [Pseudomonas sp. GD04042]MDH0484507.1 flagellar basal body L-ring protein FlgH [Pseudomonas sp. GD04015]MDH0606035.1 flagellar basal body L-ring protein FlgH [Pseudomonas sp. GD03869]